MPVSHVSSLSSHVSATLRNDNEKTFQRSYLVQGQGHVIVRFNIKTKTIESPSEVCRAEINNVVEIIL